MVYQSLASEVWGNIWKLFDHEVRDGKGAHM